MGDSTKTRFCFCGGWLHFQLGFLAWILVPHRPHAAAVGGKRLAVSNDFGATSIDPFSRWRSVADVCLVWAVTGGLQIEAQKSKPTDAAQHLQVSALGSTLPGGDANDRAAAGEGLVEQGTGVLQVGV